MDSSNRQLTTVCPAHIDIHEISSFPLALIRTQYVTVKLLSGTINTEKEHSFTLANNCYESHTRCQNKRNILNRSNYSVCTKSDEKLTYGFSQDN